MGMGERKTKIGKVRRVQLDALFRDNSSYGTFIRYHALAHSSYDCLLPTCQVAPVHCQH